MKAWLKERAWVSILFLYFGMFTSYVIADESWRKDTSSGTILNIKSYVASDVQGILDDLIQRQKNDDGEKARRQADIDDINTRQQVRQKTIDALTQILSTLPVVP